LQPKKLFYRDISMTSITRKWSFIRHDSLSMGQSFRKRSADTIG
jgi:hypothetical protein